MRNSLETTATRSRSEKIGGLCAQQLHRLLKGLRLNRAGDGALVRVHFESDSNGADVLSHATSTPACPDTTSPSRTGHLDRLDERLSVSASRVTTMMRYRVIHATYSTGMFTEFSAETDEAALAELPDRESSNGRTVMLDNLTTGVNLIGRERRS